MSRRKQRKPRRKRPGNAGKVTVCIECGAGVTVEVVLPDCTGDQYRQAQERAQAGDLRAPEIWHLVKALDAAVDRGGAPPLNPALWGDADLLKVAQYLGLVGVTAWSALDDAAVAALLRREGSS